MQQQLCVLRGELNKPQHPISVLKYADAKDEMIEPTNKAIEMCKDDLEEHGGELNNQTKRELIKARAEIKAGKFHTLAHVKK